MLQIFGSLKSLEEYKRFADLVFPQIIMCLDRSRSQAVRHNALKCFQEVIGSLIFYSGENE